MMMKKSYSSSSKTEQILSRYRPIAPKPQNPLLDGPSTPENAQQSPFLKHLQARPSRTRKRGRYGCSPAKKTKINHTIPCGVASLAKNTQLGLSLQGFSQGYPSQLPLQSPTGHGTSLEKPVNLVTLPFLPYPSSGTDVAGSVSELSNINAYSHLDEVMEMSIKTDIPQEKDLLQSLQAGGFSDSGSANVIKPQPVRAVDSSINVWCIEENTGLNPTPCVTKKRSEVEAEIESEILPVVISDSSNRVRQANSAYKEMVGQPECLWLHSMATYDELLRGHACKRICGKVMLDLPDSTMAVSSNGFTCRVRIEWGSNENKNSVVDVPCDVVKLCCESKNYLFRWRFHTSEAAAAASMASFNV